jgi:ankyrin repeat protein
LGFVNPGTRDLTERYEATPGSYFAQSEAVTNRLLLREGCLHGDVEACLRCLERRRTEPGFGFSINMQDDDGQTLLHFAVTAGHFDVVSLLLEMCPDLDVNVPDEEGYNPFMIACKDGYTELVKLLA